MADHGHTPKRLFTVSEANAMLPLVRAIVTDLVKLSHEVIERRQRLTHLLAGREIDLDDPYASELAQIEEEVHKDGVRLREYVEELEELGVEPKSGPEGLIDFPAFIDGRVAYLCWKLGEPEVGYWHELEAGFRGRHPLPREETADATPAGGCAGCGDGPTGNAVS